MNPPLDFVKLLDFLEKSLIAEFNRFDYEDENNDNIFSSEALTNKVALLVSNFVKNRQSNPDYTLYISDMLRLFSPHGFNGIEFDDAFGVKDVLEDLSLYRQSRWLFLHYELTERISSKEDEKSREEWKLIATFSNLDVAFRTRRDISPKRHHFTKVYFIKSDSETGREYFGRRIFPSMML